MEVDEGRGLWDLLFGVSDPGACHSLNLNSSSVKMEEGFQLDLPEDFLALLNDSQSLGNFLEASKSLPPALQTEDTAISSSVDVAGFDLDTLGELSAFLQVPGDFASSSSSSGSEDMDAETSSDTGSVQGSPKSTHSVSSGASLCEGLSGDDKQELVLSREELSLLSKEGLSLPKFLPLTKQQERTLKKIRRKIRNKKSAQESRRKKKVYMDQLEDQVKDITTQNKGLHKRVKDLEKENTSLQQQLKTLQTILGRTTRNTKTTGTCLMALVLSVALIMTPYGKNSAESEKETVTVADFQTENITPVRTRILYNMDAPDGGRFKGGIPLARDLSHLMERPQLSVPPVATTNSVVIEAWDEFYGRTPLENLTIELPKKNLTTATH